MTFRTLKADDLEQVAKIQAAITRQAISERWKKMLGRHVDNPEFPGLVAEDNGRVVGFIIGEIKVGGFGSELSGWIEMVGVLPELMGSGVGGAMIHRMREVFDAAGVSDVFTAVRWDSGDLLSFFKNQGFDRSPFINLQLRLGTP